MHYRNTFIKMKKNTVFEEINDLDKEEFLKTNNKFFFLI